MKKVIYVPVWLREWLSSRNLGYEVLIRSRPEDILSATDVKAYRAAQEVAGCLPIADNPLAPIAKVSAGCIPCDEEPMVAVTRTLAAEYGRQPMGDEIFHYIMVEGESAVGFKHRPQQSESCAKLGREIDFEFEYIDDSMVVIASVNPLIDNHHPGVRAELYSKCIAKMHLFMSFEEIATTEVFKAFLQAINLENSLVRGTAGSSRIN